MLRYKEFIQEKKNPCWKGYKQIGTKNKKGRKVPNCVKVNEQEEFIMIPFERGDFYKTYYENLSPSDFKVDLFGNKIIIEIPRQ